mmetsp:Transcript_7752/g.19782  ORF Transcript_7752/g.19782 Transcript_7752/m.19782 type:complete len:385 (-) Transcript_7752:47-1201(-)
MQQLCRHAAFSEEAVRACRRVHGEALRHEILRAIDEVELRAQRPNAQEDALFGHAEARSAHRRDDRLVARVAKRGHLTRRRHLDAQHGVCAHQPREREHGRLDAHVVHLEQVDRGGLHRLAHHDACGQVDEVDLERLRGEGEGARGAQVALDHLDPVVLGQELDVERTGDVEPLGDLERDALHAAHGLAVQLLRRQHERRVAGMHARVLHVLRNRVVDHLAVGGDRIHLDLLGVLDELGDHDRVLARDARRLREVAHELFGGVGDVHRRAREHVRRPDQARVLHLLAERLRHVHRDKLLPSRLVHIDRVEDLGELEAILGVVDVLSGRAQDLDVSRIERERKVVGDLPADGEDDARGRLELVDVEHALEAELLEVEPIALIVVC